MRGWIRWLLRTDREPVPRHEGGVPCAPSGEGAEVTAVVRIEFGDTLDLHHFRPRDVGDLVRDFLDAAAARGDRELRIIHGKGIGVQRAAVRGILQADPRVEWYGDSGDRSGWGATLVRLRSPRSN